MRQLVYTALKVRFAAPNLAFMITSGYTDAFEIIRPRYLNFYTVSICYLHTYIYPLQFTLYKHSFCLAYVDIKVITITETGETVH